MHSPMPQEKVGVSADTNDQDYVGIYFLIPYVY